MHYYPVAVIVLAAALYHASSKTLGGTQSEPWGLLTFTYLFSWILSALCWWLFPVSGAARVSLSSLPLAAALGLACVGIEAGFLIAYRMGWSTSQLFPMSSAISTTVVFLVGVLFFKEAVGSWNVLGLILALTGIMLLHWK